MGERMRASLVLASVMVEICLLLHSQFVQRKRGLGQGRDPCVKEEKILIFRFEAEGMHEVFFLLKLQSDAILNDGQPPGAAGRRV